MVYAACEGWYKETPDQNVLLPHDVLRIVIQLLAWGDIAVAQRILPEHKTRLYADIQERLEFEEVVVDIGDASMRITASIELVPEPTTMLLIGLGLVGLAELRKKVSV